MTPGSLVRENVHCVNMRGNSGHRNPGKSGLLHLPVAPGSLGNPRDVVQRSFVIHMASALGPSRLDSVPGKAEWRLGFGTPDPCVF